jgi:hypothetical protein
MIFTLLEKAWYIAIQHHDNLVTQHGLHLVWSHLNAKAIDFIQKSGVALAQPQAAGTVSSLL